MIPVKVCLNALVIKGPIKYDLDLKYKKLIADEVNVLEVKYEYAPELSITLDTDQNEEAIQKTEIRFARSEEAMRRKKLGLKIKL